MPTSGRSKKLSLALLCLTAGCGSSNDLTPVTLSEVAHSIFYAPQYAAIELGYFEEEGIDLLPWYSEGRRCLYASGSQLSP